jgi:hypothetical protein
MVVINPTTELEAVNAILGSVGESPVSTLDGDFVDAQTAQALLQQVSRRVQSEGWSFNTETEYPLAPDNQGRIFVPRNTLKFKYADTTVVMRGFRLYDRTNRSYTTFTDPITAELVLALDYEELPEPLRQFIFFHAGRIFQDRFQGDDILHSFQQADELRVWSEFLNHEGDVSQWNMLNNSALSQRLKANR